jgi:hypothetical protein
VAFGGSMIGTLDDVATPCSTGGPELIFEWVSDTDGLVTIDTLDTTFDTILYVSEGVCGDAATAICNDDAVGLQSSVDIVAVAGVSYFFHVEQWNTAAPTGDVLGAITR